MRTREALSGRSRMLARGGEAVEVRHADVHEDEVRAQLLGRVGRLLPVGGLARDLEVLLGVDEHPQPGADEVLVVGDEDPHAHAGTASRTGRRASTRNPGPSPP